MTTRTARRKAAAIAAAAFWILGAAHALAHDPGLSALDVHVEADRIVATLSLAAADAREVLARDGRGLTVLAAEAIELRVDGAALAGSIVDSPQPPDGAAVAVSFTRQPGARLMVRSTVVSRLPRGHRQLVVVRGVDGRPIAERMLGAGEDTVDVALEAPAAGGSLAGYVGLGLSHILGGYDHLMFLAAVLLGVPRLKEAVKTVTAFTAAHSLTLALAVLDLAHVPPAIVEPLIAASIVFVGIENLVRDPGASRWKLTFAFGLVHGFGFAAALRDLGLGGQALEIVRTLGAFNAGVEAGQIAVAVALWPFVRRFRHPEARRLRVACSSAIALAGVYWLVERTML